MSVFDHEHEAFREKTRRKAKTDPSPLPSTSRGVHFRHRLSPPYTRSELARAWIAAGGVVFGLALASATAILLLVERISPGWTLGLVLLALLGFAGLMLLRSGLRIRRVSHIPDPYFELDEIDLTAGGSLRLAFVQERGAVLTDLEVKLLCDETIIHETEVPCSSDADPAHMRRREHRINGAGRHVDVTRTPHTSRIFERRLIHEARLDATHGRVTRTAEVDLDSELEPSGETADHKIVWTLEVAAGMPGGPPVSQQYPLRLRRE